MAILAVLVMFWFPVAMHALDNGLARTPPMGWSSGTRFRCDVNCEDGHENCISEKLYKEMADRLVADDYKIHGYEYVHIGDCWMELERNNGKLQADISRFPNGIKALADYVHSKGLKLGLHVGIGTKTCAGYPGSDEYYEEDASTFAAWGVDMIEVDGCNADAKQMGDKFPLFSEAVIKTGRPILFSCLWPLYQNKVLNPDYTLIAKFCNSWRSTEDINDSWESILSNMNSFRDYHAKPAGPGGFNDLDAIMAGNFGLSDEQENVQFMIWSILASPLFMSNDLRAIRNESRNLLKNKEIIAVNQDPLGRTGQRKITINDKEIWIREISPISRDGKHFSHAIVIFSRSISGGPSQVKIPFEQLSMENPKCYKVYNIFDPKSESELCLNDTLTVKVNPSGATMIIAKVITSAANQIYSLSYAIFSLVVIQQFL